MIQTRICLASHTVEAAAVSCALLCSFGPGWSRVANVSFPGFSTHCPVRGMWTHFVKCEGLCRHGDSVGYRSGHRWAGWPYAPILVHKGGCKCSGLTMTQPLLWAALPITTPWGVACKTQQYRHGWSLEPPGVLLLTGVLTFKTTVLEPRGTLGLIFPFSVYNAAEVHRDSLKVRHSPAWVGNEKGTVAWRERNERGNNNS